MNPVKKALYDNLMSLSKEQLAECLSDIMMIQYSYGYIIPNYVSNIYRDIRVQTINDTTGVINQNIEHIDKLLRTL